MALLLYQNFSVIFINEFLSGGVLRECNDHVDQQTIYIKISHDFLYFYLIFIIYHFHNIIVIFELLPPVGTPPPHDTWHAFLFGLASSGFPPIETRGALLLSGLPQGEAHDTHKHHIRTIVMSHTDDRHILSGYVCPDR